jgi:hypothetical protein
MNEKMGLSMFHPDQKPGTVSIPVAENPVYEEILAGAHKEFGTITRDNS